VAGETDVNYRLVSLRARFLTFIAEQQPFAAALAAAAWDKAVKREPESADDLEHLRVPLARAVRAAIAWPKLSAGVETTPGVTARERLDRAEESLAEAADGFLRREAIERSLTPDERREILRGMILTRAVDNRLKTFFTGSEVRYENTPFQGKGFRSLGQEAIYAAAIRLKRGASFRTADGEWQGDVIGPIIRDVGAALAMRPEPETVRMILNGQMAKAGPPMEGRDLHVGDFSWGILPASAPLSISSLTVAGMGLAFGRQGHSRVAVSFIGEGGSSLGEWHEAINLCAAQKLPVIFCLENNQTALSTPVRDNSAARMFADKAAGYGIPGITIDGTDPDAIAAAFTWAAERARAGLGATLIELVAMRMCGHAHHDDMLYLGKDPQPSWTYPPLTPQGYADPGLYEYWRMRDPIPTYAKTLEAAGVIGADDLSLFKDAADAMVEEQARAVIAAPWPDPASVTQGVLADDPTPPGARRNPRAQRSDARGTGGADRGGGTGVRQERHDVS
jgi:TPP-dependent pyruvate/acetoin dehydrogenase alpha subunit